MSNKKYLNQFFITLALYPFDCHNWACQPRDCAPGLTHQGCRVSRVVGK